MTEVGILDIAAKQQDLAETDATPEEWAAWVIGPEPEYRKLVVDKLMKGFLDEEADAA